MPYPLIIDRVINTPLLISEEKLQVLTSDVFIKLLANQEIDRSGQTTTKEAQLTGKLGIIPVFGSLVNKNGAGLSGITSYQNIKDNVYDMLANGVTDIIFDVSSHGGEASGNFPLTDFINNLPNKFNIRTYGFTDSIAASGGYSILAATQKVFATDMAIIGSIAAIASLVDSTKLDEDTGLKYKIVRSRKQKQIYNPHEGITEEALNHITEQVQNWDTKFFSSMEKYRPQLTNEVLTELDGRVVNATKGIEIGLVDEIVTSIEDVFAYIGTNNSLTNDTKGTGDVMTKSTEELLAELTEVQGQLVSAQRELTQLNSKKEADISSAVATERDRCLNLIKAQETLGVSAVTMKNAITKGYSVEMATEMFTEIKAGIDESSHIDTTSSNAGSMTLQHVTSLQQKGSQSFNEEMEAGLTALNSQPSLFAGVR